MDRNDDDGVSLMSVPHPYAGYPETPWQRFYRWLRWHTWWPGSPIETAWIEVEDHDLEQDEER